MPRGIDEALFPRFFSQAGREIVPVVTTEGARELALRTLTHRLVSCGRKRTTCPQLGVSQTKTRSFLRTWKRLSRCDNHAGIQVGSSHCPSKRRHLGTGFFTLLPLFHRLNFSSSCLRTASADSRGSGDPGSQSSLGSGGSGSSSLRRISGDVAILSSAFG